MTNTSHLKESWLVNPEYGKENVYQLWDADGNYHSNTDPDTMDKVATLMQAAPDMLHLIKKIAMLNENAGEIGAGMLANLIQSAREIEKKATGEQQ